jgi:hypothetical protein
MEQQFGRREARVFNVRVWSEDPAGEQREWRGRVYDAASGEARYFRDWATLVAFFTSSLADALDARECE